MSGKPAALHWVAPGSPRQVQEAPYQGGRYQIYPWKGGWTFNRTTQEVRAGNKSPVETHDTSSGWKPRCGIMARQNPSCRTLGVQLSDGRA